MVFDGVTKLYGDTLAVKDFSLEIQSGELIVLVGPSGCGKTTLLRLAAGLEELSSGHIHINGRDASDLPPARRDVAMVFQDLALYPHMDVRANLAFGLKMRRVPRAKIDERVKQTAAMLEIEDLLTRRPDQLSGGQRQRVAIGRAIVRRPVIFFFDEPLSDLDAKLRVQMRRLIRRLHDQLNTTIVYVTHDQEEALTLADRVVVISEGELQQAGRPAEVYRQPANLFVAGFIGNPPMNLIPTRLELSDNHILAVAGDISFDLGEADRLPDLDPTGSQEVVLGLRPESLHEGIPGDYDSSFVQGTVELVELSGPDILLHLRVGTFLLALRIAADRRVGLGDKLFFSASMSEATLFDPQTGRRLIAPELP